MFQVVPFPATIHMGAYAASQSCSWIFTPSPYQYASITVTNGVLLAYDTLTVHDGGDATGKVLANYSGDVGPPVTVFSTHLGSSVFVTFTSSSTDGHGSGFSLSFGQGGCVASTRRDKCLYSCLHGFCRTHPVTRTLLVPTLRSTKCGYSLDCTTCFCCFYR